jgi:predicted metal-dependent phosphotriesterase family hydrolase
MTRASVALRAPRMTAVMEARQFGSLRPARWRHAGEVASMLSRGSRADNTSCIRHADRGLYTAAHVCARFVSGTKPGRDRRAVHPGIEQGIDDTGIKAGIIKVASGAQRLTRAEEKVFTAAARASKATGIPITTHTNSRVRVQRDQVNPDGLLDTIRKTTAYLKQLGMDERQVRTITVDNPRRFFG